jgi:hypothetical protein
MPLVVPGIQTSLTGNQHQADWINKLTGKKLSDSTTNETVSQMIAFFFSLDIGRSFGEMNQRRRKKERKGKERKRNQG